MHSLVPILFINDIGYYTFCLINVSGRSTYSSVHCRWQSVSCCSRLSVEQSSITHHCCVLPPSLHLLLSS